MLLATGVIKVLRGEEASSVVLLGFFSPELLEVGSFASRGSARSQNIVSKISYGT